MHRRKFLAFGAAATVAPLVPAVEAEPLTAETLERVIVEVARQMADSRALASTFGTLWLVKDQNIYGPR